MINYRIL